MAAVWTPSVRMIVDGEPVEAATDNGPISDLTNRTDWLKSQLEQALAGKQLILRDQTVGAGLVDGTVVYIDGSDVFQPALAEIDTTNLNIAGEKSFWQGFLVNVNGTTSDVIIGGSHTQTTVAWAPIFEDGVFAAGNVYLSAVTPGLITTAPGTTGIYLGHMRASGELLVRLGTPGGFIDHVHLERTVLGKPAGTVIDPAPGNPHVINTPDALQQGWLPANATYFPGFVVGTQIPTGAKFGYNIQHANESDLRQIFPVVPPENSQFSQSGLVLDDALVVTNNYGIWWLDDSYGNAPWPVDYAATPVAADITLWTTRVIASTAIVNTVITQIISDIQAGDFDPYLVTSILSGNNLDLEVVGTAGDGTSGWGGQITITNKGVTGQRVGRGLAASAPLGDNTTGYKELVDLDFAADLPAPHLWTELSGGGDTLVLVTTNGAASGTPIDARGHRLGPAAADFIDFMITGGSDLPASTDYQITLTIKACVDVPAGAASAKEVDVSFYRLVDNTPVTDTAFIRTEPATFIEGVPGDMQTWTLGPYADVVLQTGEQMLIRLLPSTGGSPLTSDTLRVLAVNYTLAKV